MLLKLNRMRIVRDIELMFATPSNPQVYRGLRSAESMLAAAADIGAARIQVSMGMGHRRALNASRAIDLARRFLRIHDRHGEDIGKITVKGRPLENQPMEIIDLLEYRLVEQFPVTTRGRIVPGETVRQGLVAALNAHDDELSQQFGRRRRR